MASTQKKSKAPSKEGVTSLVGGESIKLLNNTKGTIIVHVAGGRAVQMLPPGVPVPVPAATLEQEEIAGMLERRDLLAGDEAEAGANDEACRVMAEVKNKALLSPKLTSVLTGRAA